MDPFVLALGLSLTPLGGELAVQDGFVEARPSLDVLDLEAQIQDHRIIGRLGRALIGAFALEIADVGIDWLYQPRTPVGPHVPFWGAGVGVRVAGNTASWVAGPKALGRVGLSWGDRARTELFAELHVAAELGPHATAGDMGLRLGVAWTWGRR